MKLTTTVLYENFSIFVVVVATTVSATRSLGEVSMDQMEDCHQVRRPKHDIIQGDVYVVKSDAHSGKVTSDHRQPAECSVGFNFGDRLLSVSVVDWSCDRLYSEPYLSVYADCDGRQKTLLAQLNCSTLKPISDIDSSTSCLSLYHFRGHRKGGYYFVLHVVAGHERIAFPAGGIAAIVIATVVILMVIAKVICVVTGYERRLPNIDYDADEDGDHRKRMYINSNCSRSSIGACSLTSDQQVAPGARPVADFVDPVLVGGDNGFTLASDCLTQRVQSEQCIQQQQQQQQQHAQPHQQPSHRQHQCNASHPSLCVTHSNGSVGSVLSSTSVAAAAALSAATELAANCNFDLDFLDLPTEDGYPPRLKRYPSARASNMWRHK